MATLYSRNHILIVNFPGEHCLREVVDLIHHGEPDTEIIVLSTEEHKLQLSRVEFVPGLVTAAETYQRADLLRAHCNGKPCWRTNFFWDSSLFE